MAYTRLQRSINARRQLRDRKGRWIFMGGGLKFRHGGKDRRGRITGVNGDYIDIESVNPDTGRTETIRKHRSEVESDGSKASISQARSRVRARRSDPIAPRAAHNKDADLQSRLGQLGIPSDDAKAITRANSRDEAEDAWNRSERAQAADRLYADIKDKPALSSQEKAFKTRYENTKNAVVERFQGDSNETYEDGLGNYSIPKSQIDAKRLRDIEPGDRILGKGERNSPEISKTGDRDKTTGEVLEVIDTSRDDSGRTTLKVRDEDGNEREYTYSRRALDNTSFAPASSLYDPPEGDDDASDVPGGIDAPDTMNDISDWETIDPNERGDGPIRMRDPETGDEYYVKIPDDNEQAKNDDLAARLYDEAGIRSATQDQVKLGDSGRIGTASPAIPDAKEDLRERIEAGDKEYLDDLREGFAVDAWLGNTNPGGEYNENILTDSNGQPVRVSQSGALLYDQDDRERALKNSVTEWNSMRRKGSPSADLYRDMTQEQLAESARRVTSISDEDIDRIVDSVGLPESTATPLKETLKKRRDDIAKRAGIDKETPAEEAPRQEGSEAQRPARRAERSRGRERKRAQEEAPAEEEQVPAEDEDSEPSLDELEGPSEDELVDEDFETDERALFEAQSARRGDTRTDSTGEVYTKTSVSDEGTWEDSQGNEYTDEEVAALTSDRDRGEEAPEPLTDHQRLQASKASERPVGGVVTDDDGDSYTKNDDGEWVRDDTGDVIGNDEDLARYVEDRSLHVDENNPSNFVFNPDVIDNRDYRPTDENGVARDRTPEESEALNRAKEAQPGDIFVDDDGDEYVKHENDKWTRADESLDDGGYNNSEAFMAQIGPWNPRPADRQEGGEDQDQDQDQDQETSAPELRTSTAPRRRGEPPANEYDIADEPVSDNLAGKKVFRSKDGEIALHKDDEHGWQVLQKATDGESERFQPSAGDDRRGTVDNLPAERIGDDLFIKKGGGDRFDDTNLKTQKDIAREVSHLRDRKAREQQAESENAQPQEEAPSSPSSFSEETLRDLTSEIGKVNEGDLVYDKSSGKEYRVEKVEPGPGRDDIWTLKDTKTGRTRTTTEPKKFANERQERARQAIQDATPLKPGQDELPKPSRTTTATDGTKYSRYDEPFLVEDPDGQRHLITGVREIPGEAPDVESITIGKNGRALGTRRFPHRDTERAVADAARGDSPSRESDEPLTPTDEDGLIDHEEMRKRLSDMEDGAEVRTEGGDEYRKEDGIWTNTETGEQVDGGGLVDRHEAEEIERIDPLEDEPHAQRISELDNLEEGTVVEFEDGERYTKQDGVWVGEDGYSQYDSAMLAEKHEAQDFTPEQGEDLVQRTPPTESRGRITDPAELDSRPEGSRIQISQNNRTRTAVKGEDGKWRDEETGRVIAKPIPKNSNVTDLPEDTPEVDQNIGGDRDSILDGLNSLPSGSRVDIRRDRSEGTKSHRKNDDGSWTDEDGNTREAEEIADEVPEDVIVDRIGSTPDQDRSESADREIPGQTDLFDDLLADLPEDEERAEPTSEAEAPQAPEPLDGLEKFVEENAHKYGDNPTDVARYTAEDYLNRNPGASYEEARDAVRKILDNRPELLNREDSEQAQRERQERLESAEADALEAIRNSDWDGVLEALDRIEAEDPNWTQRGRNISEVRDAINARKAESAREPEGTAPERSERAQSFEDSEPGDSISTDAGDFFTKDDDGRWYDTDGNSYDSDELDRHIGDEDYTPVSLGDDEDRDRAEAPERDEDTQERPEPAEAPETPSEERTEAPEAEEDEAPDTEVPEKVQEEMEEAVEAFDPEDPETQANIAALDAMPRGTQISNEGVSFTKMVKYWKQDDYPADSPKSGNRYTSEDVLFNVDINDALVTMPEPPKSKKEAPSAPAAPTPTPVQVDEFGNEFIDNGSGRPIYKGDSVSVGGRSPMNGVVQGFSPDGSIAKVRDNRDGRIKTRKSSDVSPIKMEDDAPDFRGEDKDKLDNLPVGSKLSNDDLAPTGEYLEKRPDGVWERKNPDGSTNREYTDDDMRSADWDLYDKKAADDRREKFRKEREAEEREEERIRKREEREEERLRRAEEREEAKIMRQLEREEERRRAQEEKQLTKEIEDWLKEENRKEREKERQRDRNARDERVEAERREREERRKELEALKRDIIERDREQRKKERDEEKKKRDRDREEARKAREEKRERDRERRERERRRKERDRDARRRREDDEDEKKKRKKRRRRPDPDGGMFDGFPGGWPGGLPLPRLPSGKKPKKPKKPTGRGSGGGSPTGGRRRAARPDSRTPRRPGSEEPLTPEGVPAGEDLTPDRDTGLPTPGIGPEAERETRSEEDSDSGFDSGESFFEDGIGEGSDDSGERGFYTGLDSDKSAEESAIADAERSATGAMLTSPGDMDATRTGTMIARPGAYDEPFRKTEDGTWVSASGTEELTSADLMDSSDGGDWQVVDPNTPGVLLEDDQAFADARPGVVVVPTENSPASEMGIDQFEKQADGTWQAQDGAGQPIGTDAIGPESAAIRIGPAIVDTAPEIGISSRDDDEGFMRLVGNSREQINEVAAPRDTPQSDHMQWTPGTPISSEAEFANAVEGTTIQAVDNPNVRYRKNSDNTWSLSDANGSAVSETRIPSVDLARESTQFRVDSPSTAAGMEFASRVLSDRGEMEFLPTLSVVSSEDPATGAGYYTKQPDGSWRFVPPVGSSQAFSEELTSEEFARVVAEGRMTAYPSSSLPVIPQVGARAISSRDLQALPQGTVLTDGLRQDGEGRTFVKAQDGSWTLFNRSGVEQGQGFTDQDIEGLSRHAGVVVEEFAGPFSADDAPIGTRVLAQEEEGGPRRTYVKTATGRWARLDGDGNPIWPEISQEELFDTVDPASVVEFSRPRVAAGDPATSHDIHTAPVGSRIGVDTPEGDSVDFVKTGFDEWTSVRGGSTLDEEGVRNLISAMDDQPVFRQVGNGEVETALDEGYEPTSPNTLRSANDQPIRVGTYVEDPQTGVMGMVESINPASGQAFVRDVESGVLSPVRGQNLSALSRNPAADFAEAEGQATRISSDDVEIQAPRPDTSAVEYGQPRPTPPALSTYDEPLVPQEWSTAVAATYESMPANSGRRFEDSPFAPILTALSRRGIQESPFITEGGRRAQPGVEIPRDAFGMISAAGLSSQQDASAARAAYAQNLADAEAIDAENAASLAQHAEEVARWGAANGADLTDFNAQTYRLKGIGPEEANYVLGTDYWMDATFVSIEDLPENQQIALKYAFGDDPELDDVVAEIRNAGPASIKPGYEGFSDDAKAIVDGLDGAIVKSSFRFDTRVVLTAKIGDFRDSEGRILTSSQDLSTLVGSTITDYGYMTPSVDTFPVSEATSKDVVMYIRVPAGYNGAWIGGKNSDYGTTNAREVVLPRGTKMFVHRVGTLDGALREMYAEIVPIDWFPTATRPVTDNTTLTGETE